MEKEELLKRLERVNELTSQETIKTLYEAIVFRNIHDPNNDEIFRLAKEKGVIL